MIPGVGPKTHKTCSSAALKPLAIYWHGLNRPRAISISAKLSAHHHHHDHSIGNETTLGTPLKTIAEMEEVLWELVEEVGGRLRQRRVLCPLLDGENSL